MTRPSRESRSARSHCALACLLFAVGCGSSGGGTADGNAGSSSGGGSGGSASASTGGGVPSSAAGSAMVPLAGSGQAVGGGDQGTLFGADGAVPIMPVQAGGSGGSGGGGSSIPGDGHMFTSMIRGSINGTAVFTQKLEDVTVVVNLSGCADGNHQFRIYDGYSCDSPTTEGMPWSRGTGIGPDSGIACSGGKGTLTYTRSGADKTKNWTVGDHVQATDLTAHVVIVSDEKDPNSRASCGNFF